MATKKNFEMSLAERKHDVVNHVCEVPKFDGYEDVDVCTVNLEDGIAVKSVELKRVKVSERNQGLKWQDFSIDSLSAVGAAGNLEFSQLMGDRMKLADDLDRIPQISEQAEVKQEIDIEKNIE